MNAFRHRGALVESVLSHLLLVAATVFALYPVLWVVSTALTHGGMTSSGGALPIPHAPTLENFRIVTGVGSAAGPFVFLRQVANSIVIALATASSAS